MKIKTYLCSLGESEGTVISDISASKARYRYFLHVRDCCPDIKITQIKVKSLSNPGNRNEDFERVKTMRGRPDLSIGTRIKCFDGIGYIVGADSSANFKVRTEAGHFIHLHPGDFEEAKAWNSPCDCKEAKQWGYESCPYTYGNCSYRKDQLKNFRRANPLPVERAQ